MLLAACSCQPMAGAPLLTITAKPQDISDQGEVTAIKVVTTPFSTEQ